MIQQKTDEVIPEEMFKKIWAHNPDGFGLGFLHQEKNIFKTKKTLKLSEAYKMYADTFSAKKFHGWMIIHWRFKTHGDISEDNCHPFLSGNDMLLGHNGVIKIPSDRKYNEKWSDTRYFASVLPNEVPHKESIGNDLNGSVIHKWLGGSRLAIIQKSDDIEKSRCIYWNFPDQKKDHSKYGLFSNYSWEFSAGRTRGCGHTSASSSSCSTATRYDTESSENRYQGFNMARDVAPELPTVWWIVERLMDDPMEPYLNMMDNFHATWGRHPTAVETAAAHDAALEIYDIDSATVDVKEETESH